MGHVKVVGYGRCISSRQPGNIASAFVGDGSDLSSFTAEHMHKDGGWRNGGMHGTHGRGRASREECVGACVPVCMFASTTSIACFTD